ncbi:hypothetical protein J1614_010192 [Plenodomus biglobosus]|nr:hypothetical protein J1614_010192 [Plenodomus biglobosus]
MATLPSIKAVRAGSGEAVRSAAAPDRMRSLYEHAGTAVSRVGQRAQGKVWTRRYSVQMGDMRLGSYIQQSMVQQVLAEAR